ncbi:hypothetical protein TNCV_3673051 [Trichonephila clavipes]|nr:hypothetical protein TNCV_3673051 [Trichonephila clavipes]
MGLQQVDAVSRLLMSCCVVQRSRDQFKSGNSVSRKHSPGQPRALRETSISLIWFINKNDYRTTARCRSFYYITI